LDAGRRGGLSQLAHKQKKARSDKLRAFLVDTQSRKLRLRGYFSGHRQGHPVL
jgi:hypothetical protein